MKGRKNHIQRKQEPPNSCLVNLGSAYFSWLPFHITLGKPGSCLRARQVYRDRPTQKHVLFPWVASFLGPQVSHTRGVLFLCHFLPNNRQEPSGLPASGSGTVTIYFPPHQDSISKPGVLGHIHRERNGKVNRASGIAASPHLRVTAGLRLFRASPTSVSISQLLQLPAERVPEHSEFMSLSGRQAEAGALLTNYTARVEHRHTHEYSRA